MRLDAQVLLYQALNAHKSDLEIERAAASDCGLEERLEAARRVLQWLKQATSKQAQPEDPTFHHDVNLLLGKTSRPGGTKDVLEARSSL
jgi:hypothetical protein